ncbi:shikimate 5-dehydrogenase [Erwinia amylovora MR1]|nr:shikimate 5-dehydrogenase [Erwinia amylovora MR1]
MSSFVVIGNPINHSKSPRIHQLFAEQTGIAHPYERLCAPLDGFEQAVRAFLSGVVGEPMSLCRLNSRLMSLPAN